MRLVFDNFFDELEIVEEERINNKKIGEELSLTWIDNGHEDEHMDLGGMTAGCVIEIKRKQTTTA